MATGLPKRSWATVYTDASFDPPAAGVAFWAASRHGRLIKAEPILEPVRDSLMAELHAVHVAVERTLQEWPMLSALRITSDSKSALGFLKGTAKNGKRDDVAKVVAAVLAYESHVFLKFVWVKGHQNSDTVPAYVNRQVDEMAKMALRQARKNFRDAGA